MATRLELYTQGIPEVGSAERFAQRAEAAGWDGISLTDSQNLVGDPFIAMALGAKVTTTLKFMTGVSNVATRHPAALATTVATVQEISNGRAILGIGRGDTALFHLGRKPMPIKDFFPAVEQVHAYLAHFSAMPGSTGAGLDDKDKAIVAEVGRRYDSNVHLMNAADHSAALGNDFVDRFGVVGPPSVCLARLVELAALGLDRFVITGPTLDADREQGRIATRLFRDEVLPVLHGADR